METPLSKGLDPSMDGMVCGDGATMRGLDGLVAEIAKTDIPVVLAGESGTGKEVYARLIHRSSGLGENRLKKICCASVDAGRLLTEAREGFLVGGKGEAGTVFLDGVHELDAGCQRALLSLLPDGEPKGRNLKTMLRLVSTTSCDLEKEIQAGRFRRELYFRINGMTLRLPPLRERKEDIPVFVNYFLAKHAKELRKDPPELSSQVREQLASYDWPGNIRELENVVRKIVAVGDPMLALSDLRAIPPKTSSTGENGRICSLKAAARAASRRAERELILRALEQTHWNRKRAAQELQISYKSLLYKIKQIEVETPSLQEQ